MPTQWVRPGSQGVRGRSHYSAGLDTDFRPCTNSEGHHLSALQDAHRPPIEKSVNPSARTLSLVMRVGIIETWHKMRPCAFRSTHQSTKIVTTDSYLAILHSTAWFHWTMAIRSAVATAAPPWRTPWPQPRPRTSCAPPRAKVTLRIHWYAVYIHCFACYTSAHRSMKG